MQKNFPKVYCFVDEFNLSDLSKLSKNINIIYRNYKTRISTNKLVLLKKFCKNTKRDFFISNDIKTAIKFKLDGIYIPSFNKKLNFVSSFSFQKKFKIIGSAHNIKEIKIKEKQGCKEIFISPIFHVDKKKKFLNIHNFNKLIIDRKLNYIALGGINEKNYKKVKLTKSLGFAAINWIKKNGLSKLRPF